MTLTKTTKGKQLFDESVKYLELQGLWHGDFSCYYFNDDEISVGDTGGISLSYNDEAVAISVLNPLLTFASAQVEFKGDMKQIKGVLDLLIFSLKITADERQKWLDDQD